jgi:diguanylate cyclase (GGDEF)-like protein
MKISTKLLLIIVLATTLIELTALAGVLASANLLESQIKEKFMAVSTYAMEKVHRLFSRRYEDLAKLAQDPVLVSPRSSPLRISAKLKEYERHFETYVPYASLSFFDLHGKRIAGTEANGFWARRAFPGNGTGWTQGRTFLLEAAPSDAQNGKALHLAHVVRDANGVPVGIIIADLPVESLQQVVKHPLGLFRVNNESNVDLVDAKGRILFSTHDKQGILRDISPLYDIARKARPESGIAGTTLVPRLPGKRDREIVVFAREAGDATFPGNDWTLIMSLPERAALAPLLALKNRLALVFVGIAGIAIGIVLMLSRTITRPLEKLHRAIGEVGKGNLDAVVEVSTYDEIGQLSTVFNRMVAELKRSHGQLRDAASVDSLTGAFNRKGIEDILRQEVERARRSNNPLSLILFDLDHFKGINDTHGHLSGDLILKNVISIVKDNIRRTDPLGRWGGEEFMLLTPGTGLELAVELAEKIRRRIEGFPFERVGAVTISCGVSAFLEGDACTDLIKRADDALYSAKAKGRNVVEVVVG